MMQRYEKYSETGTLCWTIIVLTQKNGHMLWRMERKLLTLHLLMFVVRQCPDADINKCQPQKP